MATRYFDLTLAGDVNYVGDRWWKGDDINKLWNLLNYNSDNRAVWGLDSQGWLQYRSAFASYSGRYNLDDLTLGNTYFDVEMAAAGTGNYEIGFFIRFIDRNSFYYLTFQGGYKDWGNKNIRFYKVSGQTHTLVAEVTSPVFTLGQVYHFRCEAVNNNVKIYKDGVLVIDWTDTAPNAYTKGAFGPWVLGQEFAKWKGFQAKNNTPFSVSRAFRNENVTNGAYSPTSGRLLSGSGAGDLLKDQVEAYLASLPHESWSWRSFRMSTSDARVIPVFDQIEGKNTTTDSTSRIYVYQTLPTAPPLAPANFSGVGVSTTAIRYNWTHADDSEDGFRIYDENKNLIATVGENTTSYVEDGLNESTSHSRYIVAYNAAGESVSSNIIVVQTSVGKPAAPQNFQGIVISDTKIKWTWELTRHTETAFELIGWDEAGNIIVLIDNIPKGSTEYLEEGLQAETSYIRAVRAKNAAGIGPDSNPVKATTRAWMPNPPVWSPMNFYGLGVSDSSIFWYWLDTNEDEDGYEIVDADDRVVGTVGPNTQAFLETGLASLNVYQRKVRPFNAGGAGPATDIASARTLAEGLDQTGKPVAAMNLYANVISETEAQLLWTYNNDSHVPAVGFKLYTSDGSMLSAIPVDARTHMLNTLNANTTYRLYIVAYNDNGESLKTNIVEFATPHYIETPPSPIDPSELEDPYYGVDYDEETLEMDKIKAFQSGVGDGLDLAVRNLRVADVNFEIFSYEVYLQGVYDFVFEGTKTTKVWESARVIGRPREVAVGETVSFSEQIASPMYDVNWQDINARFPVREYKLIFTSSNPNVNLYLEREIKDFFPEGKVYVDLAMKARIINETQTSWYPSIHAGYYYLNQQEWFLYADDKVQPKNGAVDEQYILRFPYVIRAHGGQHYNGQDIRYIDTTKADFLQGTFDSNIDLDRESGSITLRDQSSGIFTSRMFRFGRPVTDWMPIEVDIDAESQANGGSVKIEVGEADYLGNVVNWHEQQNGAPINIPEQADKVRYRLTLKEGFRREVNEQRIEFDNWRLEQGYKLRTYIVGDAVMIQNTDTTLGGTYITPPIELGENINDMGTVTLKVERPGTSSVSLYSVSFDDPNTNYRQSSVDAQWVPLQKLSENEEEKTSVYRIASLKAKYVCIVVVMTRGVVGGPRIEFSVESMLRDGIGRNIKPTEDKSGIEIIDPYADAYWMSNPIYLANPEKINIPNITSSPENKVKVIVTSADSKDNVLLLAQQPDGANTWRVAEVGKSISSLRPWIIIKVILLPTKTNVVSKEFTKLNGIDFSKNSEFTNWSLYNDEIIQADPTKDSIFTSEIYDVKYLNVVKNGLIKGVFAAPISISISYRKDGVWRTGNGVVFGADGTAIINQLDAEGASHFRFTILIKGRQRQDLPPGTTPGGSGGINDPWRAISLSELVDDTHPAIQNGLTGKDRSYPPVFDITTNKSIFTYADPKDVNMGMMTWESKEVRLNKETGLDYFKKPTLEGFYNLRLSFYSHLIDQLNVPTPIRWIKKPTFVFQYRLLFADGTWSSYRTAPLVFAESGIATGVFLDEKVLKDSANRMPVGYQLKFSMSYGVQNYYKDKVELEVAPLWIGVTGVGSSTIARSTFVNPFYTLPVEPIDPTKESAYGLKKVKLNYMNVLTEIADLITSKMNFQDESSWFEITGYVSPKISAMRANPSTVKLYRVVPKITEVRIAGHIREGYALETYAVPMWAELVTDFKEYTLTDKNVEDLVYEYLMERGMSFDNNFQFTDYQLDVDPIYPVILRTDSAGMDKVYGRATRQSGELLYRNIRFYFGPDDHRISLKPVPQNGSPICIRNAAGQLLRHVHFRDQYGKPTLDHTETPVVQYGRYLFLETTGIDRSTLSVSILVNGSYKTVTGNKIEGNRLILAEGYASGTPAIVSYRITNSFIVDYNSSPDSNVCDIQVHTPYDPGNLESRLLDIKYEVNEKSPYYVATEVNLNPLRTTVNSGFMYLTDKVYPPYSVEIQMNPNVLYRDREDRVVLSAIIKDEFGNPVVGEKADFTASIGGMQVIQRTSDENGMVIAAYTAALNTTSQKAVITVQVIARDAARQISRSVDVFFMDSQASNKIAILPEKHMVTTGDVVKLKVKVMGANEEPLSSRNVALYADQGRLSVDVGTTNSQGEVDLTYTLTEKTHTNVVLEGKKLKSVEVAFSDFLDEFEFVNRYLESDSTDGFVYIEAESYDDAGKPIREQILLAIGV